MSNHKPITLTDFPAHSEAEWQRLANDSLKGKKLDGLKCRLDGLELPVLPKREGTLAGADRFAFPGVSPFHRGSNYNYQPKVFFPPDLRKLKGPSIDAARHHEAGASAAEELAAALLEGVEQLRHMEAGGKSPSAAHKDFTFTIAAEANQFVTIAKFRVMRHLWTHVLEGAGVEGKDTRITVHAAISKRMQDQDHRWDNFLKKAGALSAAMMAGADGFLIDEERLLKAYVMLSEESHLCHVMDPAGGADALESLSMCLIHQTWELFQQGDFPTNPDSSLADYSKLSLEDGKHGDHTLKDWKGEQ